MIDKIKNNPWPLIVFASAFSIRSIYLIEVRDHPFFSYPQLDSRYYDDWAWGIAQGNWIGGDKAFFASPFYAYFLAIVYRFFGHNYFAVRLLQIIVGSTTWVLTYWIGKDLFSKRVGILAALIGSFYSYSIFMDGELLKNSLAAFTTTLTIYLVLKARDKDSSALWLISGLALGLTVLSQPNVLLFIPLFIVWGVDWKRRGRQDIASICAFILGAALMISPVTIRNYVVEKDFVLVTYNGGINFFVGNNKDSDGGIITSKLYKLIPQREEGRTREIPQKVLERKLKSSEISGYWFSLGKKFIAENPLLFIKHTLKKFAIFWNWYEVPDNVDYYFFKRFSYVLSLPLFSFGNIAPLAVIGLLLSIANWQRHLLSYGIISIFVTSMVFFMVFGRYRLPMVPLFTIYAAFTMDSFYTQLAEKRYKWFFLTLLIFALVWGFSHMIILRYPVEHSQRVLGDFYSQKKMFREAVNEYSAAIKAFPFDGPLRLSYANALDGAGRKDKSLEEYRQSLYFQMDISTKAKVHSAIGSILLEKGDTSGAEKAYLEALRLDDKMPDILNNLAWLYAKEGKLLNEAVGYAERALTLIPETPEYIDTLGLVLMKKGRKEEGVKKFEQALKIKPDSLEFREHLKKALEHTERHP